MWARYIIAGINNLKIIMQVILAQFIKKINVQISKRLLSIVASRGEKQVKCSIMEPLNQQG